MDDPVKEIRDVVRSITEPYEAAEIIENIDKYFTHDAFILHPLINQPQFARGKEYLKGIYKWFRTGCLNNKITFHAVMFNEDLTQCAIELTEYVEYRPFPLRFLQPGNFRFLVRVDLRLEPDGKYRIWRQHDIVFSDLGWTGLSLFPGSIWLSDTIKGLGGYFTAKAGLFLLRKGWGGP
ncbi:hypothetical protein O181_050939 [Austropuccinia psidii MF-1]|uniref:SigF-like NTF2-like domain-containing protein n=1 Tax=Austropuccinia psidii MF-1 TaxID=1389203 RepID=A0A9Q3HQ72_9BASI|nr:hypothetical protein [Austropuccinia psidii MF-1]